MPKVRVAEAKINPPLAQDLNNALAKDRAADIGELHDRINNLEFLNKVVTSDLQRSNLLLREVLSQLYKDKDEYHADLHDKIVKELGE